MSGVRAGDRAGLGCITLGHGFTKLGSTDAMDHVEGSGASLRPETFPSWHSEGA